MPVYGVLVYIFLTYSLYCTFKYSPEITVDEQNIIIGQRSFPLKNITELELTGKQNFPFLFGMWLEGSAIVFTDETEIYLYDDFYSNLYILKLFLEQTILNKQKFSPTAITPVNSNEVRFEIE